MFKVAAIGLAFMTTSAAINASEMEVSFTNKDMVQNGATYSYALETMNTINASVLEVDIRIQGEGDSVFQMLPACTEWQGSTCVGAAKDILHSEFLHEVDVSVECNGQALYQKTKNNIEFTNEEIVTTASQLAFVHSEIKLNRIECSDLNVNVRTVNGANDAIITGVVRFKDSTSIPTFKNYDVNL
ncbi:hypothetical protein [Pseudoalteromonas sp. MMG012]|uniref:hypothetical protein n=1 Tax=Pseudoalteromonas sp. MMG012 TaxID=2822686 RepID=UPI001B3A76DE|nr:hypothetical protein [Pseudoalteromonas sp. MMG012]MBQ4850564.1 hypothetical protein [Pseudoalteromonas sp. MMG012]